MLIDVPVVPPVAEESASRERVFLGRFISAMKGAPWFHLRDGNFKMGKFLIVGALLYDWFVRFVNRDLFYSSAGVLPQNLNALSVEPWHFSIFYMGNSPFILTGCFLLGLAAYLGLAFAKNTRLFALLSLIFQVSLANRNIYPGFCTDIYSALLIWLILFPNRGPVPRILVFGYIFQIGLIYTASGISKMTPGSEWFNGSAITLISQYSNITNGFGSMMGKLPQDLQTIMCFGLLALEFLALPLLLLRWTRNWMILALLAFHTTTFLTMNLGELPFLMAGALISISTIPLAATRKATAPASQNPPLGHPLPLWQSSLIYGAAAMLVLCLIVSDVYNRVFHSVLQKWNVNAKLIQLPAVAYYITGLARIRQTWTMYASPLPRTLVWPQVTVTTQSGRQFNLINREEINWSTPKNLAYYYDHRLYKYYNALYGFYAEGRQDLVRSCGDFMVRDWNSKHPSDPMQHIGIWFAFAPIQSPDSVNWIKIY